ncbi:hypothetical protein C8R46DRAFT_436555 [Mycena filopes]|nr:hypothetical protein C8R46DRAFT_436555 [Mycena filopes]
MMSWRMECEDSPSAGEFRQGFGPHIVRDSAINHPPSFKMPHQLDARVQQIIAYLAPALALLAELADAVDTPFLPLILTTVQNLIAVVQTAKRNRAYCIELMSDIHQILLALIGLHLKSDASGCLPPSTLHHVGKFTHVLHKIYTYINAQQERKSFQAFFQRRGETSTLLESCRSGLREAVEVFKIDAVATYNNLEEMKAATERMQTELLELIASTSEGTLSEQASAIYSARGVTNSSNSFSMLPSKPQIFHGRDSELAAIIKILKEESPRIAILGGGGMGKTTLARAVLHHENTTSRFERTIFVTAESVNTSIELAARVALYLGLEPGRDSTKSVINCLRKQTPCLLILDNLETPWEPGESRPGVEEFLSAVTSLPQIALIITMRGSERPGNVRWSHPFLSPLGPLSDVAARQTFAEVADESLRPEEIDRLLQLTDNMPLAVDLIAHLVDYEGASSVLARWETERTSLLVAGEGHVSNLDTSIDISISSPRMTTAARELLSLLSVLPDGLAYVELIQITNLPIVNVLACQTTLLATALAYRDNQNRLRSLVPVREHVQRFFPPSPAIIRPLRQHFHSLLELYREYNGVKLDGVISRITSNLGNLQNILRHGLRNVDVDSADTIHCTISLSSFARITGIKSPLMDCIPPILHQLSHHSLEVQFATELLSVCSFDSTAAAEVLIADTRSHLQQLNQPVLEYSGVQRGLTSTIDRRYLVPGNASKKRARS